MTLLNDLYECVWDAVEDRLEFVKRPSRAPLEGKSACADSREAGREFPALRHLDSALALAEQGALARIAAMLREIHGALAWSQNPSYDAATLGDRFMSSYVFGQLTGEDAGDELPMSGFLLMGPHKEYRAHRHAPREVYLLLTPGACWQLDAGDWHDVAAGRAVFHDAWQYHAMRTGDAPMLAFAAWLDPGDRNRIRVR